MNHLWDAFRSPVAGDLRDYLDNTSSKEIRTDIAHMLRDNADVGFLVHVRETLDDFLTCKDKHKVHN